MEKIIDLHIHTNFSDGILSPKEVIDEAYKNGASIIAIADHDTVEAYSEDLYNYAKEKNIKIINAVEISTRNDKVGIHVLGYNIDINNIELKERLSLLRNARHDYLYNVASKLKQLGYILDVDKLDGIEAVTKAHIALDVVENANNKDLLLEQFGHIPNKGEFIETIMNEGCPAYVKKETITPVQAAELIRLAGGKVVLAHPVAYKYEDDLTEEDVLKLVNEMKADGIETYYVYVDRNNNKINESEAWSKFATDNNYMKTVGSDFHNEDGIRPVIGLIGENLEIDSSILEWITADL